VNRALLVAAEDVVQAVAHAAQLVVDVQHRAARVTEDGVHAFFDQRFTEDARTAHQRCRAVCVHLSSERLRVRFGRRRHSINLLTGSLSKMMDGSGFLKPS
jgi:hypothetical protein